jgi:putative ABC transport system permease protein
MAILSIAQVLDAQDSFRPRSLMSTLNSRVAFEFRVTPGLLAQGMGWALGIGLLGGLPPAWRVARLEVATVLRSL